VFVYDVDDVLGHLVNPVLHFPNDEDQDGPEGCLSLPDLTFDCLRKQDVVGARAERLRRPDHRLRQRPAGALHPARDRPPDGVLFIDRLDAETKKAAMAAIREADWAQPPVIKTSPHPLFGRAR
jgi:peptide deformylase